MNNRHAEIDRMAEAAHREIRAMTQQARDAISVKVGWMIRSSGAKQGWRKRKADMGQK